MGKIYFKEEQHFSNLWYWVILIVIISASLLPTVVAIYSEAVLGNSAGENPTSLQTLMITLTILILTFLLVILLFRKMCLVVEINDKGLFFKYPPFINKKRQFLKEEISHYEIRKYKPIMEYGGWGIRYGWGKSGQAYTAVGKTGLQLYLVNGKKVLFGTQMADTLKRNMDKMMQKK